MCSSEALTGKNKKQLDEETSLLTGEATPTQLENFQNDKTFGGSANNEIKGEQGEISEVEPSENVVEEEKPSIDLFKAIFEDEDDFAEPPTPAEDENQTLEAPEDSSSRPTAVAPSTDHFDVPLPPSSQTEEPASGAVTVPRMLGPTLAPTQPKLNVSASLTSASLARVIKGSFPSGRVNCELLISLVTDFSAEQLKSIIGDDSSDSDDSSSSESPRRKSKSKEKHKRHKHKSKHKDKDKSKSKDKDKKHKRTKRKRDGEDDARKSSSSKRVKPD